MTTERYVVEGDPPAIVDRDTGLRSFAELSGERSVLERMCGALNRGWVIVPTDDGGWTAFREDER